MYLECLIIVCYKETSKINKLKNEVDEKFLCGRFFKYSVLKLRKYFNFNRNNLNIKII